MNLIHDNEVNLISDYNLLYDILNTSKYTKIKISIIPLFWMDVWIHVRVNQDLRNFTNIIG